MLRYQRAKHTLFHGTRSLRACEVWSSQYDQPSCHANFQSRNICIHIRYLSIPVSIVTPIWQCIVAVLRTDHSTKACYASWMPFSLVAFQVTEFRASHCQHANLSNYFPPSYPKYTQISHLYSVLVGLCGLNYIEVAVAYTFCITAQHQHL